MMLKYYNNFYPIILIGFLSFLIPLIGFSQCDDNLVTNGSLTGIPDNSAIADGWKTDSYPDINDASGMLFTSSPSYNWIGTILPSNDGGSWQNIIGPETIYQFVNLSVGTTYELCFEYAAQGIASGSIIYDQPVGAKFILNDEEVHTSNRDTTQYSWELECISFIANQELNKIEFQASEDQYLGIDGVCIKEKLTNSIAQLENSNNYFIYPNILSGNNQFRISAPSEHVFSVEVFNSIGMKIYHKDQIKNNHEITLREDLPQGFYYLHFILNGNKRIKAMFIIQ